MKKIILLLFAVCLLIGGCKSNNLDNNDKGSITDFSKKYLSKGYVINVGRTMIPLSDSIDDIGKGNVQIAYNIRVDYYLNVAYQDKNDHLKSQSVKNIKIIKSPKKGTINDIYANYVDIYNYDNNFKITGSNNVYTKKYDSPYFGAQQTSIFFVLENVAFMDSLKYEGENTAKAVYDYLGIDTDAVSMKVSFRVEFVTFGGKTLYKDFVIDLPPAGYDITGDEFQIGFTTDDINQMEPFLEI
jgi:hypothetical protein